MNFQPREEEKFQKKCLKVILVGDIFNQNAKEGKEISVQSLRGKNYNLRIEKGDTESFCCGLSFLGIAKKLYEKLNNGGFDRAYVSPTKNIGVKYHGA